MQTIAILSPSQASGLAAGLLRLARATPLCLVVCWLLVYLAGCSGGSMHTGSVARAEAALTEADQLVSAKQYAPASVLLDQCIGSGGLNSDLLSKALVLRAQCLIEQDRLDEAEKDLERAMQGPAPLELYHLIRGQWLEKLGKHNQALREFETAKQHSTARLNGP